MIFSINDRTRRIVAAALAASLIGGTAAGAVAATTQSTPQHATVVHGTVASTVPKEQRRAGTAAGDVIGFPEKGQPGSSPARPALGAPLVGPPSPGRGW
jgi:hypothetical protein